MIYNLHLSMFLVGISLLSFKGNAQSAAFTDAAQAYNKLLLEKNNSTYKQIDNYKVIGSPYFLGEKRKGDLYAKGETAYNIYLSYNTYNQEVEFYSSANPTQPLSKEPHLVDSFEIKSDLSVDIKEAHKFINGSVLGADKRSFYRVLYVGNQFSLFKKYKASLGIVTTNYVQSDLRQFDLQSEYYYYDHSAKELRKLKSSYSGVKNEFKKRLDTNAPIAQEEFTANPDAALISLFKTLNEK